MNMTDKNNIPDVTLAHADPALLLCWEEKVKHGIECSLLLKHSKGRIITTLKTCSTKKVEPKISVPTLSSNQADKKKRKKGKNTKRLGDLLSYHQRLVEEKGLPPSKLMLEQAALASFPRVQAEPEETKHFKCEKCDYATHSAHGVKVHMDKNHQVQQKPVVLNVECDSEEDKHQEPQKDPPEADFKCPSCLNMFSTEHSLSRHIYHTEGYGVGDRGNKYKVKCHLCNNTEDCCIRMISHVEQRHKRTSTLLPNLKNHFTRISRLLGPSHGSRDSSELCTVHIELTCRDCVACNTCNEYCQ